MSDSRAVQGQPANANIGGAIVGAIINNPQIQQEVIGGLVGLLGGLLAKLLGHGKSVSVPADERPPVENIPDDKIIPAPPPVTPPSRGLGYTSLKLAIEKAQFNHELFPEQYTEDNQFGLYRPAMQTVYNRRSKIWFDATPFKGAVAVQADEGERDGIIWKPVFHLFYNGAETVVKASLAVLQDTANGASRPIQVVEGDSVGVGFSAWDFARGFLCQIQVGDNEGGYRAWVEIPELGLRSSEITFTVS